MTRGEQAMWAVKLENALNNMGTGDDYRIWYDACESGMTFCYCNGELYMKVANDEMKGSINVPDFRKF